MDTSADTKLGELLGRYQRLKADDPSVSIQVLRTEAGPLFAELEDLVDCLDLVLDDAPGTPSPEPLARRRPARWVFVLAGVACVMAVALAVWQSRADRNAVLVVRAHPHAEATLDGGPLPLSVEAGRHQLRLARPGFETLSLPLDLAGGEHRELDLHLAPLAPFDPASLEAISRAYGITHKPLGPDVPHPVESSPKADSAAVEAPTADELQALKLERMRLPEPIRESPSARMIIGQSLYRLGHYRAVYQVAADLIRAHPDEQAPVLLALHALWGLELVDSTQYQRLHARYLGDD